MKILYKYPSDNDDYVMLFRGPVGTLGSVLRGIENYTTLSGTNWRLRKTGGQGAYIIHYTVYYDKQHNKG